jgi:glycosyltransferase involved in cell wall biosynthesis
MTVSVIIPAFNEEAYIEDCLKYLQYQIEKPFEIIVIDNNSTDKTVELAKKFKDVRIISEKKQGITFARNAGFNEAKGDILARTDADTRVQPDWIKKIKEAFEKDEKLLGLSGPGHYYDIPDMVQYKNWVTVIAPKFIKLFMNHDGMLGFNMAIRKTAWDLIKNEICLDDSHIHEDADLAIHLAKHGKVFLDETLVVQTSLRQLKKRKKLFDYLVMKSIRTVDPRRH